jgi:hypothetical protein
MLALIVAGCSKPAALSFRVSARSHDGYVAWKSTVRTDMGPWLEADFDDAVKEIGLRAQAGGTTDDANQEAKTLMLIDGRTVRGVIRTGLGWKLKRLLLEKEMLGNQLGSANPNAAMPWEKWKSGQDDLHAHQRQRLKDLDAEIAGAQAKLKALGDPINDADGPFDPVVAPTPLPPPPPMIRVPG